MTEGNTTWQKFHRADKVFVGAMVRFMPGDAIFKIIQVDGDMVQAVNTRNGNTLETFARKIWEIQNV